MQLTIEVLPAPFGPMMENSSPDWTEKLTSVSARTPPKRSDTPRTSNVLSNRPSCTSGAFRALDRLSLNFQRDPISALPLKPCDQWQLGNAGTPHAITSGLHPRSRLGATASIG